MTRRLEHGGLMTVAGDRSGVLVVRAWIEGDPPQLKARITQTITAARHLKRDLFRVRTARDLVALLHGGAQ